MSTKKLEKLTKVVNFRISEQQEKEWTVHMKIHRFRKLSAFVRWCVEEVVEGTLYKRKDLNNKEELKERIIANESEIREIVENQREMLKIIAQSRTNTRDEPLRDYQKGIILNLIQQKPRNEEDLQKIFPDSTEIEILDILNELMETSLIKAEKNKYVVI